jgi:hypothetical protein
MTVTYKMTELFFDRPSIIAAINEGERKALGKIGAYVRQRAKTDVLRRVAYKGARASVRRIKGGKAKKTQQTSRPGSPPIVHSRDKVRTLKNILFAFNPETHSVVIGPVALNKSTLVGSSARTVMELLEKGGSADVPQWKPDGSNVWSLGNVRRAGVANRMTRGQYAARPFMGPALEREVKAGTIADAYRGFVQG